MDNGRKSYFATNENSSNNSAKKVEIEIKELNLEGDGNVSGDVGPTSGQSDTLNDNSSQQSSDSSNNTSNSSETVSDNNLSQDEDNQSDDSTAPDDDLSDGMEDVSDDSEPQEDAKENKDDDSEKKDDNKEKKDDDSEKKDDKSEDDKKEQPDKQKLDENKGNQENNGEEQTKQNDENPTEKDNQPKEDNNSSTNENNSSSSDEDKPTESKESSTSEKEQSSGSSDGEKKDSKEDSSKQKNESSEKDNKSHNSGKKDNPGKKDERKGGLPKNNPKGRSPQDIKNNLKNRLNPKNIGKNAFNRTKLGQNINKAKNAVNNAKKAVNATKKVAKGVAKAGKAAVNAIRGLLNLIISTMPWSLIIIVVVAIIAIIIGASVAILPGSGDNVTEGTSNYSEVDQKTLQKLQTLFKKYPNADGTLAMAVVLYPYYEVLYGGETNDHLNLATDEESQDIEDDTELDDEPEEGDADIEDGDEDTSNNDIYLEPFRKLKLRNKLKTVLKKLNKSDEEEFKEYLKDNYFKKDKGYSAYEGNGFNGYKKMFDSVPSDKRDALANSIIEDLYEKKEVFINYVFESQVCSSSSTSLGYSDGTDLINGRAVVVLKDSASSSFSEIKAAASSYGTDDYHLDLKRYVMGVAYAEVGEWVFNEQYAKVAMIAAKSHLLGRNSNSGTGMGYKPDYVGDMTVFYTRNNTYDQGFCDIYEGCKSGSRYAHDLIKNDPTGEMWGNVKAPVSVDKIALLEQWYDETAGEFIYDTKSEGYYSAYLNDHYGTYCPQGACLLQVQAHQDALNGSGYEAILKKYFSNDQYVIKNIETNTLSAVAVNCTNVLRGGCTIPENEFVYYSQRSYSNNFCGRTDGTISSSGCGVTSMAMIIANLTDNKLTPVDTMNEAHQGGHCGAGIYGTNSSYFSDAASKHGLNYETLAASDTSLDADKKIKDTLNSGGLIIANVAGATTAGSGNAWSTVNVGHYLVIKGITSDEKLIIADPMTTALNNPWKNNLTIEEMRSYMHNKLFYLFTGGNAEKNKEKYCGAKGAGYLGNPLDPNDITRDFVNDSVNGRCFPNYCGSGSPHGAVDIAVSEGNPVYAMDSGIVEVSQYNKSWGNYVLINHGNGYKTLYAHFSELGATVGQQVTKGQQIGKSGNTGNSTGPHLHIELQNIALYSQVDRETAKKSEGKGLMNPAKYINSNISYVGQSN